MSDYSAIYDKKNVEFEIASSSELPFSLSSVSYPTGKNQPPNYSAYYNGVLQKLKENDLYLEQLTLNVQERKNVYGATVTGKESIALAADEGMKYILTANNSPHVQMVHKVPSEINDSISVVSELTGKIINFVIYEDEKYVVGTSNGLYCSENLLSGWRPVGDDDLFAKQFEGYNCKTCIRNQYQGSFPENLKEFNQYQYFLGTNYGLYGLKTMDVVSPYWRKLHRYDFDGVQINSLKFEMVGETAGKLYIATNIGLFTSDGVNLHSENGTSGLNVNEVVFIKDKELEEKDQHILIATSSGIKQSKLAEFTKEFKLLARLPIDPDANSITCVVEKGDFVYFSYGKTVYKLTSSTGNITSLFSTAEGVILDFSVFAGDNIFYRVNNTIKSNSLGTSFSGYNGIVSGGDDFFYAFNARKVDRITSSGAITNIIDVTWNYITNFFKCYGNVYGLITPSRNPAIELYNIGISVTSVVKVNKVTGSNFSDFTPYSANLIGNDASTLVYSFGIKSYDFDFTYLSSNYAELSMQIDSPVEKMIRDDTGMYFYNQDLFAKYNLSTGYSDINVPSRFNISLIDGIYSGENNNVFVVVGRSLYKFNGTELQRIYDNPMGEYSILYKKIFNQNVKSLFMIDNKNFLVGTMNYLRYIKNLKLALEPKDFNRNLTCKGPVTAINVVKHATEGGITSKYMYGSGRNLFSSENNIEILEETSFGSKTLEVNSIYSPNGYLYCICTSEGLYIANMGYVLMNDLATYDVQKIREIQSEAVSVDLDSHITNMHREDDFITALNRKAPAKLETVPDSYTLNNFSGLFNQVQLIERDVVEKIEFNDDNKYIKAAIQNWAIETMDTSNIYSDSGFIDHCRDPYDGTDYDFSVIPYVCKFWNSGMKEIVIYVPTTMTYYMNNPYGFTNSIYNNDNVPRKNVLDNLNITNKVYENNTILQIFLNNVHFQIKNIYNVQINGNSLPLRIYKDDFYCQKGRENLFDTTIQPSVVNFIPTMINAVGKTNVESLKESMNLILTFSIYGTDSQSIRILAE